MSHRDIVPERVAMTVSAGGLGLGSGLTIAKRYAECSECGMPLADALSGGRVVDRDIEFETVCPECETGLRVLVEEKVWGIVDDFDAPEIPASAETFGLDDGGVLFLNPTLVYVSEL